jgi:hypothetical protein
LRPPHLAHVSPPLIRRFAGAHHPDLGEAHAGQEDEEHHGRRAAVPHLISFEGILEDEEIEHPSRVHRSSPRRHGDRVVDLEENR